MFDTEKESTKQSLGPQNDSPDAESYTSDIYDPNINEVTDNNEDLIKKRQLLEKIHRLSSLKRKSDEFLQKNYYSDPITEKRAKIADKKLYKVNNHLLQSGNYENKNVYDNNPTDVTNTLNQIQNSGSDKELSDGGQNPATDNTIELKTECDDSDITVIDPAVCTTKDFSCSRDGKKGLSIPLEYQSPQESEYFTLVLHNTIL